MATKKKMLQAAAGAGGDVGAWDLSYAYFDDPFAWDVSSAQYMSKSFSVAGQETTPEGLFFKPDGTKMYVIGRVGDDVNEYDLSTAWDVSSASYLQTFSVLSQDGFPKDIFFKPDGLKMYMVGSSSDRVHEYNLSTAWDISTASFVQSFSVAAQDAFPTAMFFKPDGTKMYVIGDSSDDVSEYDLSTAWDVSTSSYVQSFSVTGQEATPQGLFFKSDGTKMYVIGFTGDDVNEYDLSTSWDISSSSFLQNFSVSAQELQPTGLYISPDGANLYVIGEGSDSIYQYYLGGFNVSAQEQTIEATFFKPDGTKLYICGSANDRAIEYNLSTAWDLSTASFVQFFTFPSSLRDPTGLFFKPDGTVMYVVSQSLSQTIYQYDLSTDWDISTAVLSRSLNVATEEGSPTGVFFKDDGTKMYITGTVGDDVNEYDLSTAWLVDTATHSQNFSVSAQDTSPQEVFFKGDGTKMYILGDTNNKVYEYDLSTAWDVSTSSYIQDFLISNSGGLLRGGLFFKDDGTKMYIGEFQTDRIFTYSLGVQE